MNDNNAVMLKMTILKLNRHTKAVFFNFAFGGENFDEFWLAAQAG